MCGPPGEIRTPDTQVRSLVLYPAELRAEPRSLGIHQKKVKESAEYLLKPDAVWLPAPIKMARKKLCSTLKAVSQGGGGGPCGSAFSLC